MGSAVLLYTTRPVPLPTPNQNQQPTMNKTDKRPPRNCDIYYGCVAASAAWNEECRARLGEATHECSRFCGDCAARIVDEDGVAECNFVAWLFAPARKTEARRV